MDCSICTTRPSTPRRSTNTICAACYEEARSLITLTNKFQSDKSSSNTNTTATVVPSSKGFANALKLAKEMKAVEEELNEKSIFLGGFVTSFRNHIHTDILVKPGICSSSATPIPAHKALLAARSDIFKNMLDSDGCKAASGDSITLPELNYEEVDSLLEFLYSGSLPKEKYNIPFLQKFCKHRMLGSLNSSNALDVLEIPDVRSNQSLKETALDFIVRNMKDVVFSARFDAFALKNPHLTVKIIRSRERERERERGRSRSRGRERRRPRSREREIKGEGEREIKIEGEGDRERGRSKSRSRGSERGRSRSRVREQNQGKKSGRSRSRGREQNQGKKFFRMSDY